MKTRINRKRLQGRTVFIQSALLLFLLILLAGCGGQHERSANDLNGPASGRRQEEASGISEGSQAAPGEEAFGIPEGSQAAPGDKGGLIMEFIDVGQGDSTLILCEGEAMLIDAGDESSGTNVQNEMEKLGVKNLKYFVCTHPDADHIGGADVIAYKFPVETLLMPELERDTKAYEQLTASIAERDIRVEHPIVGETNALGGGNFTIVGPVEQYGRDDTNDWSVCLRFTYGEMSFLFCGDAEEKAEKDMVAAGVPLDADVYHVSHHGSSSSTSEAFLRAVAPSYGVISCGRDNDYGHPHRETKEALEAWRVQVCRTDELGNIFCYSDGKILNWESEYGSVPDGKTAASGNSAEKKNAASGSTVEEENVASGSTVEEKNAASESAVKETISDLGETAKEEPIEQEYVLNTNTKKVHLPGCRSIGKMKKKNRQDVQAVLEDLLKEGYEPCKSCMG